MKERERMREKERRIGRNTHTTASVIIDEHAIDENTHTDTYTHRKREQEQERQWERK